MDFLSYHLKMMHIEQVTSDVFLWLYKKKITILWLLEIFFFFDQPVKNDERTDDNL